jgi:hypothetical protein
MAKDNLDKTLSDLAEEARLSSIGSIDYLANAKAIALGDRKVQEAIREVLGRGLRLTDIRPLRGFGSALMSFPLQLVFRSGTADPIDLPKESLVVTVEIPSRSVKRVVAGPVAEEESPGDIPFTIAATARGPFTGVPFAQLEGRLQRESAYFEGLGLPAPGMAGKGQQTIYQTATDSFESGCPSFSATYSNGVSDDTGNDDSTYDDDTVDDHPEETRPGDPTFWSPFDPGTPFGGRVPQPPGGRPEPDPSPIESPRRRR